MGQFLRDEHGELEMKPSYWKDGAFHDYPPLVEMVAKAIWESAAKTMDPHVRPLEPWDQARTEPRYGIYEQAIAAIKVLQPNFES
jgi:hypothetical protein